MTRRAIVLDDEPTIQQRWCDRLNELPLFQSSFSAEVLSRDKVDDLLEVLERRRKAARSNPEQRHDECTLDECDLFIIDYDLLGFNETGENLAYLARCYSSCGFIVALNQFGSNTFDLTLLGHPESFADLNIGDEQLENPGLWVRDHELSWDCDFRPWQWPSIPLAVEAYEDRVRELEAGALDEPILGHLGFPDESKLVLSRAITEFIEAPGKQVEETSFRDFVQGSGNGLRRKDIASERGVARIAGARVAKWLERLVLGGQDVLVDAPHLAIRLPGTLEGDSSRIEAWNATARLQNPELRAEELVEFSFKSGAWLSRDAWFWQQLNSSSIADQLYSVACPAVGSFAFCEDRSCFLPVAQARAFVAAVESPFVGRYVGPPANDVSYRPSVRFSL